MFPFTGHVTNKKWPLNEVRRTPPEESDIRPTIHNPSNILFIMCLPQEYGRHLVRLQQAGLINLENTHLRHEAEQRRGHIIHTLYHIYCTIPTISTTLYFPYLQHYIYSTIFTIPRLAPLTFTQFVLPFLVLAGGLASAAAAFLCEITCWRNKVQHQGKIRKMTWTWKDY